MVKEFDPFLLEPVKYIKAAYKQNVIEYDEHIKDLFELSPSYMFRLLKGKKNVLDLMSGNIERFENNTAYKPRRRLNTFREEKYSGRSASNRRDPYESISFQNSKRSN